MSVLPSVRPEAADSLAVLGLAALLPWYAFAGSVLAGLVFLRQCFDHRTDGTFEFGQVVVDSRLQDRMGGVEIAWAR